jgi:hypothetical protein
MRSLSALIALLIPLLATFAAPQAARVTDLKPPAAPGSEAPSLMAGPDGRVYLNWLEPLNPDGYALRFSVRGPQGWSAARTIARGTNWFVSSVDFPLLALMSDGTLAANWLVATGGPSSEAYDIHMVFSKDSGATWSKPIVPHRDRTKRQHGFLSVAPAAGGRLAAIWLDGRNMPDEVSGNMALMYRTIASNGALGPEMQIDNRTCECCQTSLAATPDGLVAVYRDRSDKEIRDISIARFTNVSGKWSAPQDLSKDGWQIDGCPVNGPAIASNGSHVAVVWFTAPKDEPETYLLMSSDSGKTFGKKIRVDGGNAAGRVEVVSLSSGDAVVSWIERTSQGAKVHLRRFAPNGTGTAPLDVSRTFGARSSGYPKMAVSGNEIVVTWTDSSEPSQIRTAVVGF